MNDIITCNRCGTELRMQRVRVSIENKSSTLPLFHPDATAGVDFDERFEVGDCPRCNGSF